MNWLTIISIFALTIKGNLVSIRKVFLFKKDLWKAGLEQSKIDNEYLIRVIISVKSEINSSFKACYSTNDGYCLKYNEQTYTVVKYCIENYITSFSKNFETHKNFLKIQYLFRVIPIINQLNSNDSNSSSDFVFYDNEEDEYVEKIYTTYKLLQKSPERDGSCISSKNNEIELRTFNIMQIFIGFVDVKILKFDEYSIKLNEKGLNKKFDECKSFNLFYFKKFSVCLESLKIFIRKLNCFNLNDDSSSDLHFAEINYVDKDLKTSLKVSEFLDYINNKFYEDHKELKSNNLLLNTVQKNFKLMFEKCLDHTKDRLIYHNVMLPIAGEYTIDYYLEEIYNCIHEFINENQQLYYFSGLRMYNCILKRMIYSFNLHLSKLQKKAAKNFFKDGHFFTYFLDLPKKIEILDDAVKIENKMCDYYNIMVYITGLDLIPNDYNSIFCFLNPIFIDDNDFEIVDGLEIELDYSNALESIVAIFGDEKKLALEENIHYFIDKFGKVYIPSEIVKNFNVQELEITFYHKKLSKVFKVIKYFKI